MVASSAGPGRIRLAFSTRVRTQVSPAVVKAMLGDGREMRSAWGRGRASQQRALRRGSPVYMGGKALPSSLYSMSRAGSVPGHCLGENEMAPVTWGDIG